jgi:hypothetical protein
VTDRIVFGKGKLWQHNLTLLAEKDSARAKGWRKAAPTLSEGTYLLKAYVDGDGALKKDWKAELGEKEYAGSLEVQSKWPAGYGAMTTVDAGRVKK